MNLDLNECHARRAWASQHVVRLREAIEAYEQRDPYVIRQDFDPVAYTSSVYVTPKPMSMEISFMAGDVVHNLRSALDHLAWQLAVAIDNRTPTFPLVDDPDGGTWKRVLFPLRSKEYASESWLPERLAGASDEIKTFIKEIQPYAAADNPRDATVWKLQELSNADKHRVPLVAVPSLHRTGMLSIKTLHSRVRCRIVDLAPVPLMLEGETRLVRVEYDTIPLSKPDVRLEHRVCIAFHDSLGIGPGMPVVDTLSMIESMVVYILTRAGRISAKGIARRIPDEPDRRKAELLNTRLYWVT
jgi:hypothetical protein